MDITKNALSRFVDEIIDSVGTDKPLSTLKPTVANNLRIAFDNLSPYLTEAEKYDITLADPETLAIIFLEIHPKTSNASLERYMSNWNLLVESYRAATHYHLKLPSDTSLT